MTLPKAALIVPYYNGSEFIVDAIESAVSQTHSFEEIILVNDGSKFEEALFAKDLAKKYKLKYYEKENGGQGSARNFGVKNCTSDFVCFLDQDDKLLPEHHETLVEEIEKLRRPKGWVYGDYRTTDSEGRITKSNWVKFLTENPKSSFVQMISGDMFVLPSASIISKAAFLKVGGFDEQFKGYEDDDLFLRLYHAGFQNSFIDRCVYDWRQHGGQTSASLTMSISRIKFVNKWGTFLKNHVREYEHYSNGLFLRFYKSILRDYSRSDRENESEYYQLMIDFQNIFSNDQLSGRALRIYQCMGLIIRLPFFYRRLLLSKSFLKYISRLRTLSRLF